MEESTEGKSNQGPESTRDQVKSKNDWQTIFRGTAKAFASGGWIPNLIVGVILLFLGILISGFMNNPIAKIVSLTIALTLIIWTIAIVMISRIPSKEDLARSGQKTDFPKTSEPTQDNESLHKTAKQEPVSKGTQHESPPPTQSAKQRSMPVLPQNSSPATTMTTVQSIVVEARLTCDLKQGAELPPSEVPYIPISGADCFLEGSPGKFRLDFVSPVRFRRQDDDRIVVINRYALQPNSDLYGRPIEILKSFKIIFVAVQTIVFGKALKTMNFFESSMTINGRDVWYYRYDLNAPFQEGPVIRLPLDSLAKRLDAQ